jgi:hypothetical protein
MAFPKNLILKLSLGVKSYKKGISLSIWLILLAILVQEGFAFQRVAQMVSKSRTEPFVVIKDRGVRVNFENYNAVISKIENGKTFTASSTISRNPFSPF